MSPLRYNILPPIVYKNECFRVPPQRQKRYSFVPFSDSVRSMMCFGENRKVYNQVHEKLKYEFNANV